MKRLFKGLLGAVLSLSILTGAASALPTSEEPQQTAEEYEAPAEQESDLTAADLVSGESMVFLPNGLRAVTIFPGKDFCTGETTDAALAEELPALFDEISG